MSMSSLFLLLVCCNLVLCRAFVVPLVEQSKSTLLHASHHHHHRRRRRRVKYLATCIPGLSSVLEQEWRDLCREDDCFLDVLSPSAVSLETSADTAVSVGMRSLLWLRTPHRIMQHVASSRSGINSREDLYRFVQDRLDIPHLLGNDNNNDDMFSLSVHVMYNTPAHLLPQDINHSHYTALTIKNALCDAMLDYTNQRPNVDLENADVPLVAIFHSNNNDMMVDLYKCLHPPGSLHKRGYRSEDQAIHRGAMKETMAAGLLYASGYDHDQHVLVDPMAGSGTLVVEAAMMAANIAPGLMRIRCQRLGHAKPPIARWHQEETWKDCLRDATQQAQTGIQQQCNNKNKILANDVHPGAVNLCRASLERAGLSDLVQVHSKDCRDWIHHEQKNVLVVTNPPWGVRLSQDWIASWQALGAFLRRCGDAEAWILSGNKEATQHLRLKRSRSIALQTGQQNLRFLQYKMHKKETSDDLLLHDDDIPKEEKQDWARNHDNDVHNDNENGFARSENGRRRRDFGRVNNGNNNKSHRRLKIKTNHHSRDYQPLTTVPRKGVTKRKTEKDRQDERDSWFL